MSNLSDEERELEASKIVADLSGESSEEGSTWGIQDQIDLEKSMEEYFNNNICTICEECLQSTGIAGTGTWFERDCDICGLVGMCGVWGANDTMEEGDAYANDPNDGAPNAGPSEDWPMDEADDRNGMLICSLCGTNWQAGWGIYCGKCNTGFRHVQTIPKELQTPEAGSGTSITGNTEKVCNSCERPWSEKDGSTTCSKCGKGGLWYRPINKTPIDVPPRAAYSARDPEGYGNFEVYRRFRPNHETGRLELIEGPPPDYDIDDVQGHLYRGD